MARKLQIEAYSAASSTSLCDVGATVGDAWDEFRALCERDAVYIVAIARVDRDEQRAAYERRQADRMTEAEELQADIDDAITGAGL